MAGWGELEYQVSYLGVVCSRAVGVSGRTSGGAHVSGKDV